MPFMFYLYVHHKFREKYKVSAIITTKEAMSFLFEYRIPKNLRPIIIKELEVLDLFSRVNKKKLKINDSSFDPEDLRSFYKQLKIY